MNTVLILFLTVIIIIAFYLATVFYNPNYLIRSSAPLNILNPTNPGTSKQSVIELQNIDYPGSVRYYYAAWIFIHSNDPVHTQNVIFNRGNNFVVTLAGSTLNIFANNNPNSDSKVSDSGVLDLGGKPISLLASIPNFPFQKWAQFVINVDGMSIDVYVDGKFVQNVKSPSTIITNEKDSITYGNKHTIGHITRFKRPAESINPQGVWSDYMIGSGQNQSVTDYHVNARIKKNSQVRTEQRLF